MYLSSMQPRGWRLRARQTTTRSLHFQLLSPAGEQQSYMQTLQLLAADTLDGRAVREQLTAAIRDCPFEAVYWETPPLTAATSQQPFECALIDAPPLASFARPNRGAFAEHFDSSGQQHVATFVNSGGDALLVAPAPMSGVDPDVYIHLASFVRGAPPVQVDEVWRTVGTLALQLLAPKTDGQATGADGGGGGESAVDQPNPWSPLWISTAGTGVAWLHVRLDQRPKYYQHQPYKNDVVRK